MSNESFYDNPRITSYLFPAVPFGTATNVTRVIAVPLDGKHAQFPGQGMMGRVLGALISNVTEDLAGATGADPTIRVGTATTLSEYFLSGAAGLDETVDIGESVYLLDAGPAAGTAGGQGGFRQIDIPPGRANITVTFVMSTDAAGTGIADVTLYIAWY